MEKIKTLAEFKTLLLNRQNTQQHIIVKVGAKWCNPCKPVSTYLLQSVIKQPQLTKIIKFYEVDIDEATDIYLELKRGKYKNIPMVLFYHFATPVLENPNIIPDKCFIGSDTQALQSFLMQLIK